MLEILLLGNCDRSEMHSARDAVHAFASSDAIQHASDVCAATRLTIDANWYPDVCVVLQSWPDEFEERSVERLLGQLPLARWICCFGAWCESDGRNRSIWPYAIRIPARRATARIRREFQVVLGIRSAIPLTASRDEVFESDAVSDGASFAAVNSTAADRTVAVVSPDRELRRWLESLCASAGCRVVGGTDRSCAEDVEHVSNVLDFSANNEVDFSTNTGTLETCPTKNAKLHRERPAAIVWDVDPWNAHTAAAIQVVRARNPQIAIVAVMGFSHPEDVRDVTTCGADAVVTKLASRQEWLETLRDSLQKR